MNSPIRRLALAALVFAVALTPALPALAGSREESGAQRVSADVMQLAKLANRRIRPPVARLSRALPDATKREESLHEPAANATKQVATTLSELRQMSALTLDPHYTPALVAAGRAYLAVTGQDPITHTTVNAEYSGLAAELATNATLLERSASESGKLNGSVRRLVQRLALTRRHIRLLRLELRRLRGGKGTGRR